MASNPSPSPECLDVLRLLRDRHNVLMAGAPGTGKSRLLNEVAQAFISTAAIPATPMHVPGGKVPIPKKPPTPPNTLLDVLPSKDRKDRKVFRTVLHQNSKHRDFVSGLVPVVAAASGAGSGAAATGFRVVEGMLYRASEHAKQTNGASLLIIDEINRGPAVQVFGGSIVAMERDKRLAPDGSVRPESQPFEVLVPTGQTIEYFLPHHLYLLAAMNQADTSVEPLDVAFLRRWAPFRLEPSEAVLRAFFKLSARTNDALPAQPSSAAEVYEATVRAWSAVNERIRIGRGPEFRLGHGALMAAEPAPTALNDALRFIAEVWTIVHAHVEEVFFGDVRGVAALLNVSPEKKEHLYQLHDRDFADEPRLDLVGPDTISPSNVYAILLAVAGAS